MQSGALAIPSAEQRLLDELSKPQQLKEINWNPPTDPLLHFLLLSIQRAASSMRWRYTHVWNRLFMRTLLSGRWVFWDLRLNPPPNSQRREGQYKAFSLGTEGEGRGRGRGRPVHWQQLRICRDLGDDFISDGRLSSNGHPSDGGKHAQRCRIFLCSPLMCLWKWSFTLMQTMGTMGWYVHTHIHVHINTQAESVNKNLNLCTQNLTVTH